MTDPARRIAENVAEVRGRIAEAAARGGRTPDQVTLVAVTKYVGEEEIRVLVEAGCDLLGENRAQALWKKAELCADLPIHWHMLGHLQRNKVRRTLPLVEMVQSADSPRLIAAIDRCAAELSRRVPILLEVNVSGEAAKHGFAPDAVGPFLCELAGCEHVEARGLMCMAGDQPTMLRDQRTMLRTVPVGALPVGARGGSDAARRDFARLRELRDRLRPNCPAGVTLDELSMGMSGDFEVAIHEGATIVRIGSALYEGVLG